MIDETHAVDRTSWVTSANGHATFPIQNLPLGVFTPEGGSARGGIAIGDSILDISAALEAELFRGAARDGAVSIGFDECRGTVTEAIALR